MVTPFGNVLRMPSTWPIGGRCLSYHAYSARSEAGDVRRRMSGTSFRSQASVNSSVRRLRSLDNSFAESCFDGRANLQVGRATTNIRQTARSIRDSKRRRESVACLLSVASSSTQRPSPARMTSTALPSGRTPKLRRHCEQITTLSKRLQSSNPIVRQRGHWIGTRFGRSLVVATVLSPIDVSSRMVSLVCRAMRSCCIAERSCSRLRRSRICSEWLLETRQLLPGAIGVRDGSNRDCSNRAHGPARLEHLCKFSLGVGR